MNCNCISNVIGLNKWIRIELVSSDDFVNFFEFVEDLVGL